MKSSKHYVHKRSICETTKVGARTRIWAFAHILSGAKIGSDVNVCDHTFIENDVIVGDRVTIKCFVALWDGLRVEDDVFIGPGVVFGNDKYPRSKKYPGKFLQTKIRKGASIGAGAVILPGIEIGAYALVAAGAVVSSNVNPFELVKGNPARASGLVCKCGSPLENTKNGWACKKGNWKGSAPFPEMDCTK